MSLPQQPAAHGGLGDVGPVPVVSALRHWALLAVLLVFCVFAVMDRAVISMLVDPIRADLRLSDTQFALLMGVAYALAYAGAALPIGYLADKLPRKWLLYVGVTCWGLAEAACGLATGFAGLFLARMAVGAGESPLHPCAHSMIADTFPRRRLATAMSIYATGNLIGLGVALVATGWIVHALTQVPIIHLPLIGDVKPWQFVFIVTGLPGILLALLIVPFREPLRTGRHGLDQGSQAELLAFLVRNRGVVAAICVIFGAMNIVNAALTKWQPAYLGRNFHLNPAQYGTALGLIDGIAGVAGLLISGWLVDHLYAKGRRNAHLDYYGLAILISSPIVAYGLFSDNLVIYLATVGVAKFATVNFMGIAAAVVQLIAPPRLRGRLSALLFLMVISLVGSSLGPLIPAVISDHILHDPVRMGRSLAATLAMMAPLALGAIIWVRRPLRRVIEDAEREALQPVLAG